MSKVETIPSQEEVLFIETPKEIVESIGCNNPEAAEMLLVMNKRSQDPSNAMPTAGEANSTKLVTCNTVSASLHDPNNRMLETTFTDIPQSEGKYSRITWIVEPTKADGRAVLHLRHRLLDAEHREVSNLYPDVDVSLSLVHDGNARYWKGVSWSVHQ
jgi:hypothetical protein